MGPMHTRKPKSEEAKAGFLQNCSVCPGLSLPIDAGKQGTVYPSLAQSAQVSTLVTLKTGYTWTRGEDSEHQS